MLKCYVSTSHEGSSIISLKNQKETYFSFFTPLKKLHPTMKVLHLFSSTGDTTRADFISWNNFGCSDYTRIGSLFVFTEYTEPFNTYPVYVNKETSPPGFSITRKRGRSDGFSFWCFLSPRKLRLYPLSIILWPPIYERSDDIVRLLDKYYRIVSDYKFTLKKNDLLRFVMQVYRDDRRCDKTQLPNKCKHMIHYPMNLRFVKILVESPRVDNNKVSKTSIQIKEVIRGLYKRYVKNYVHDIVCHISDNSSHSRSMQQFVLQEINRRSR